MFLHLRLNIQKINLGSDSSRRPGYRNFNGIGFGIHPSLSSNEIRRVGTSPAQKENPHSFPDIVHFLYCFLNSLWPFRHCCCPHSPLLHRVTDSIIDICFWCHNNFYFHSLQNVGWYLNWPWVFISHSLLLCFCCLCQMTHLSVNPKWQYTGDRQLILNCMSPSPELQVPFTCEAYTFKCRLTVTMQIVENQT